MRPREIPAEAAGFALQHVLPRRIASMRPREIPAEAFRFSRIWTGPPISFNEAAGDPRGSLVFAPATAAPSTRLQ